MVQVNVKEFIDLLMNLKTGTFVSLVSNTDVKMKKTGNPFADDYVTKHSVRNVQFGLSYEKIVNDRLEQKGKTPIFESNALSWGKWYNNIPNKIISHNGALYARFYNINNNAIEIYFKNGKPVTDDELKIIKTFERTSGKSKTQDASGLTEHQVRPFNVKFNNIESIKVNGQIYKLKQ